MKTVYNIAVSNYEMKTSRPKVSTLQMHSQKVKVGKKETPAYTSKNKDSPAVQNYELRAAITPY